MTELDDAFAKIMTEANSIFDKMRGVVEEAVAGGATQLDVAEIARNAGLEIDEKTLVVAPLLSLLSPLLSVVVVPLPLVPLVKIASSVGKHS